MKSANGTIPNDNTLSSWKIILKNISAHYKSPSVHKKVLII